MNITLRIPCRMCKTVHDVIVDDVKFDKWQNRELLAQQAFPELSLDDREMIISQMCATCFDIVCKPPDEEEDEA